MMVIIIVYDAYISRRLMWHESAGNARHPALFRRKTRQVSYKFITFATHMNPHGMNRLCTYIRLAFCTVLALVAAGAQAQSAKSDSLFGQGVLLYRAGQYQEAIRLFNLTQELDCQELLPGTSRHVYTTLWKASCYYQLGDEDKAKELDAMNYRFPPVDRRLTVKSDSLTDLAQQYAGAGDYASALPALEACARLEREALGDSSTWLANTLYTIGECHTNLGQADKASLAYREAIGCYRKAGDEANALFATGSLAESQCRAGRYTEGLELALQAAEGVARLPEYGKECYAYGRLMYAAMTACSNLERYEDAYRYARTAQQVFEAQGDTRSPLYFSNETGLAISAAKTGQPDAPALVEGLIGRLEQAGMDKTPNFAFLQQIYLRQHISSIDPDKVLPMIQDILDLYTATTGKHSTDYMNALFDVADIATAQLLKGRGREFLWQRLAEAEAADRAGAIGDPLIRVKLYFQLGLMAGTLYNRFDEAIGYYLQAQTLLQHGTASNPALLCQVLNALGQTYTASGRNDEAFQAFRRAADLYEQHALPKDDSYLTLLANLGEYYIGTGDHDSARRITAQANAERGNIGTGNADGWIRLIRNDIILSIQGNEPDSVVEKKVDMLFELDKQSTLQDFNRAASLATVALQYLTQERYEEFIAYMERAIDGVEATLGDNNQNIAPFQCLLACGYDLNGQHRTALKLIDKAIAAQRANSQLNKQHLLQMLGLRCQMHMDGGKPEKAIGDANETVGLLTEIIGNNFRSMTYRERTLFWEQYAGWYNSTLPALLQATHHKALLASAYNCMLLGKGLLLNSEIEVGKLIAESGDTASQKLYEDIQAGRAQLAKLAQAPGSQSEYDSLSQHIQRKERRLMQLSKAYGDYTRRLTVTWQDVRSRLKLGEAAIEFVEATDGNGEKGYMALVVKPGYELPHCIDLCKDRELARIAPEDLYNNLQLWYYLWHPLDKELEGVKRIYFSPAGRLHGIAIEHTRWWDDSSMGNRYEMYRLSSTRELVLHERSSHAPDAVVYGGLEFDADYQTLAEVNDEQQGLDVFRPRASASQLGNNLRGGVIGLPGTEKEARDIARIFTDRQQAVHVFDGLNGTEESLKLLSGSGKTILHIATHGFYNEPTDRTAHAFSLNRLLAANDMTAIPAEDKMLSRNGLLFAGANTALRNGPVPDNRDDGILTALELSGLDFRSLELVVLSACQTGLGEVTGEGVFGLQRGFKKAGAQTLMMSLWKVDDRATQLLMTAFYRNLLAGKSKRTAFIEAQQYLRTADNGRYNAPQYWAAFIMLDGLDETNPI